MNHAYRVVWNQALQVWMAVAEISRRKGKTKASVLLSGLLLGAAPAGAVEEAFTAASGNWSDGGNWADGTAPVSDDALHLSFDTDYGFSSTHNRGDFTVNRLDFYTSYTGGPSIAINAGSGADTLTFNGIEPTVYLSPPSNVNSFYVVINPQIKLIETLTIATSDPASESRAYLDGGISGTGGLSVAGGIEVLLDETGGVLYTGETTIEAGGALMNAEGNSLSAASRHIVHGELRLLESGAIGSLEGSGLVTIDDGKSLEVGALNASTLFSGGISNRFLHLPGSLIKTGTGTLTLTGANTYTGTTTISGGALQIGDGGTSGSIAGNVVNNSSLVFNRADDSTFAGAISGTGTLAKQGTGTLTLTGNNTYTGSGGGVAYDDGTFISNGTLSVQDGGSISHGGARLYVGDTASQTGTLEIGAGSSVTSDRSSIGNGGTGVVRVGGSGAQWQLTESLYVGALSEGTLELHDGGEVAVAGELLVGNSSGETGRVTVEGAGSELRASNLVLGRFGNGTLTLVNGGTVSVDGGSGTVGFGELSGNGTLNFGAYDLADPTTAGVLDADRLQIDPLGTGGTGTINFNQTDALTLAADIVQGFSGTSSVNQRGTGTSTLTGTNSYWGDTTISNGTLLVNGSIERS
jgi:fibronectin-binding autotransporter adhesin